MAGKQVIRDTGEMVEYYKRLAAPFVPLRMGFRRRTGKAGISLPEN